MDNAEFSDIGLQGVSASVTVEPPLPQPGGSYSLSGRADNHGIEEQEAPPVRPAIKQGKSFRGKRSSTETDRPLVDAGAAGHSNTQQPGRPALKLGKSFKNLSRAKSFNRTPSASGSAGSGDANAGPSGTGEHPGRQALTLGKSFRNHSKSFRKPPSGGTQHVQMREGEDEPPQAPGSGDGYRQRMAFRKAATIRRSSTTRRGSSTDPDAPVGGAIAADAERRANRPNGFGENFSQSFQQDPKAKMKSFMNKFSASTKMYIPTQIEVPEQLVMEQDGMLYVVDLGYTRITVSDEDVGNDPKLKVWQRCVVGFCPCCINGPKAAWEDFVETRAYMTFIFLVCIVDIVVFIVEIAVYGFATAAENKMIGPPSCGLYKIGAKWTPDIVIRGEVWRLFAPIFLHAGVIHILLNLFAQLTVGFQCEYTWGTVGLTVIYLTSGIVGNILSAVGEPETLSVGASGSIMGLIGGQITHTWVTWSQTNPKLRMGRVRGLIVTLVILVGTGFLGSVDNWVHFGGLVTGAIMGCVMFRSELVWSGWKRYLAMCWALFGTTAIIVLTVMLFTKQRDEFIITQCEEEATEAAR